MNPIDHFTFRGETLATIFVETISVAPGVTCDVYTHPETGKRDLGIINIEPGHKTPRQRVLEGTSTIEGYISGRGRLVIEEENGERYEFPVNPTSEGFAHEIKVGQIMQWLADPDSDEPLVAFEICFPPYEDGRFENLKEEA